MYHTYTEYTEDLLSFLDMCLYHIANKKYEGKRLLVGVVAYEENAGGYKEEDDQDYVELIRKKYSSIMTKTVMTRENGKGAI